VSDLVEFLHAQIVEDERDTPSCDHMDYQDRFPGSRFLDEAEVKRKLIKLHSGEHYCPDPTSTYYGYMAGWAEEKDHPQLCPVLRLLGSLYAARPGYRQEWRP